MNEKSSNPIFPSVERPWLRHYSPEAVSMEIPERTLFRYIEEKNKDYPDGVVYRYYGNAITYGTLFQEIRRAARALKKAGVKAGDLVTIQSMHTPETIYLYYAVSYLGAVANMVYVTLPPAEVRQGQAMTGSRVYFIMDKAVQAVMAAGLPEDVTVVTLPVSDSMAEPVRTGYRAQNPVPENPYPTYAQFVEGAEDEALPEAAEDAHAPAVIVYTSGTTGEPKGVVLSSHNINAMVEQYLNAEFHFQRGETYLDILPTFLAYGTGMLQLAASVGIESTLWLSMDPVEIGAEFNRLKPNHFAGAASMVEEIIKQTTGDLSGLVNFTGGGESLSPEREAELNQFLKEHNVPEYVKFCSGYGMSEVASSTCANSNKLYKKDSLGLPLPKTNVKIVDEDSGKELPLGEVGEICFCTPCAMLGYYKNEEATRAMIEVDENGDRWVHTGDLGCMDEDGFLFYKGKLKRIYICITPENGAMKFFPARVEDLVDTDPGVERSGVIALPHPKRGHAPGVFLTRAEGSSEPEEDLIARVRSLIEGNLPDFYEPAFIRIIDIMPRTASGKVDYVQLEKEAAE